MTIGQLLAWLIWISALCTVRGQRRWSSWLAASLGLRLASRMIAAGGSWLQRYAAVAFSPTGSLLLWALLTCVAVLLCDDLDFGHGQRTKRALLYFVGGLMLAEAVSGTVSPTGPMIVLGTTIGALMVIHTLTIFGSYGCQLVLLGWGIIAPSADNGVRQELSKEGVVTAALFLQLLGTVSGALWADQAWGTPWNWDPIECLSLSTLIWLATLRLGRSGLRGRWHQLGLAAIPIYTILGTALVRSGLLARASRHGYLPTSMGPVILISLTCVGVLAWLASRAVATGALPTATPIAMVWGLSHWLAGLVIVIVPAAKNIIAAVLTASWLVAGAWLVTRYLTASPATHSTSRKP